MPLSESLFAVDLAFECPLCNHPLVKRGGWFKVVARFKCKGCQREIQLGYADKVALFEKHAN